MIYTVTITREDGLSQSYSVKDKFIRESSLVQFHVHKMLEEMLDTPEITGKLLPLDKPEIPLPERRSALQPGQKLEPLNPEKPHWLLEKLREADKDRVARMTEAERAVYEVQKARQRDAILYGTWYPKHYMNTWEDNKDE